MSDGAGRTGPAAAGPGRVAAPRGFLEYLPAQSERFAAVLARLSAPMIAAGYAPAELPVVEYTELFTRGVGESTDVVSKEMYTFADRGGRSLTLRPELTAGVMRAVIEHGLDRGQLPVKLRTAGVCYRAERPQAGRGRQFYQVDVEAIGVDDPALDAEVVAVAEEGFRGLGLRGYRLELTSLGDATCRPPYRELLMTFLAGLDLDADTRRRAALNPLRVLDDKRPEVQAQLVDAPLIVDHLCPECAAHFAEVRAHLAALDIHYALNPRMVRGLDYYTKTTFEFVHPGLGAQSGLGGGGRYDGLMASLGGPPLSGIGFGLGIDRTLLAVDLEGIDLGEEPRVAVYLVPLGDSARARCVTIAAALRAAGLRVDLAYGRRGLKGAMKAADRSGARFAVVLGDRDLDAGHAQVKDLASTEQSPVPLDALVSTLKEKIS
ncbi:MAG: histidine--tRNA ligase [Actinomycetota bacterium]|nr:histidine--tRNA ligase [Actinomycetota bacterium]